MLHNYLAAVGSLIEHTRNLWKAHLPREEYDAQVRVRFVESPVCVFVQDLRNYALHNQLPFARGHMIYEGGVMTWAVKISRDELQASRRWRKAAKTYLASLQDDGIDLADLVATYTDTVTRFNDWFGETFVERRADDFMRVRAVESQLAELLGDGERRNSP